MKFQPLSTCRKFLALAIGAVGLMASSAFADTISPVSFAADLGVGESTTIRKTVVVSAGGPTSALVDIMFVFDITGSMSGAINGAKSTAAAVLSNLNATYGGNVASGAGWYADPTAGVNNGLTTTSATTVASINTLDACNNGGGFSSGLCGGDYPEAGYNGIVTASAGAGWRAGSNRFIVMLGDAPFNAGGATFAAAQSALTTNGVKLIGVDFGGMGSSITGLGGTSYSSGTSGAAIAAAIQSGITAGFGKYTKVTVGDLGGGLPEIAVSTVCVSADTGACVGADAVGTYDRTISRTFEYDVTFTRVAAGDKSFSTFALVDGGIVATEADRFTTGTAVPEPESLALVSVGLLGLVAARRRRQA